MNVLDRLNDLLCDFDASQRERQAKTERVQAALAVASGKQTSATTFSKHPSHVCAPPVKQRLRGKKLRQNDGAIWECKCGQLWKARAIETPASTILTWRKTK